MIIIHASVQIPLSSSKFEKSLMDDTNEIEYKEMEKKI